MVRKYVYPFTAVLGQEQVKKALLLNVINPQIKGVLLSGQKGTAKSTLVRGLAAALEDLQVVELPLSITEDRLLGSIDLEKALQKGEKAFEPGLLAQAHGQILYVDEVNLLSEHIVHSLLDVAQSGVNCVEREGISHSHLAQFILVGTMNPEEGSLGAQFLDRFGLFVEVEGVEDIALRMEIVNSRLAYEKNPTAFVEEQEEKNKQLQEKVQEAKERLSLVQVSDNIVQIASQMACQANCPGHRADLILIETARALAAWDGREYVNLEDLKEAAPLVLPHRKRNAQPQEQETPPPPQENEENEENTEENNEQQDNQLPPPPPPSEDEGESEEEEAEQQDQDDQQSPPQNQNPTEDSEQEDVAQVGETFRVVPWQVDCWDKVWRKGNGRRSKSRTNCLQGRYVGYRLPKGKVSDLAFDATLRAAAPYQKFRDKNGQALALIPSDLREKVREKRVGNTLLFLVDASGSMGAQERMKATKGAIVSLLTDAYQKRDSVGLVAFRKTGAEILLDITRSVDLAQKRLKDLPTGGRTPLASGLSLSYQVLKARRLKDPEMIPVLVLISDGRANLAYQGGDPLEEAKELGNKIAQEGIRSLVVDTENDFLELGLARELAEALGAQYYKLDDLNAGKMVDVVKNYLAK